MHIYADGISNEAWHLEEQLQDNPSLSSFNEDSLVLRLREGHDARYFYSGISLGQGPSQYFSGCPKNDEKLIRCVDNQVETMENFYVGTNNFLLDLGTKVVILETATIQKFHAVDAKMTPSKRPLKKL